MKRLFEFLFVFSIAVCVTFLNVSTAGAQDQDRESFTLEEITVTAEKRETNLQKTSISMSVMGGESILNNGLTTIADVLRDMPSVSIQDSGTGAGYVINVRGMGNDMPNGESTVSINFDGAYDQRGESTLFGFFDVDRVEVLRGPQGTLYGRSASGGAINIVSASPKIDTVEGYASAEVAEYNKKKLEAAVNVPMGGSFAGRLSFATVSKEGPTKDDHGYRDPVSGLAARVQFRYMPDDETSVNFLVNYTEKDGQTWVDIDKPLWDSGTYDINRNTYPDHLTNKNKVKTTKMTLNADFKLGPGNLAIIPTYQTTKGWSSYYGFGRGDTEPYVHIGRDPYDYEAKIGEVRYTNSEGSDIKWTVGLYYTKTDDPLSPEATQGASEEFESKAAFAQVTYPFSGTFRGIAGLRYDDTTKSYYDGLVGMFGTPYLSPSNSETWNYFDFKLGIEKDFSESMMGYFTVASGHKAGGFDDDGLPYDMEENISGELGLKSRFLANRLQVNGDVFYYLYDGYQAMDARGYLDPVTNLFSFAAKFKNADKARSMGAEIETTALLGSSTVLTLNFAYLNNEYVDDFILTNQDPQVNLKGKVMPHSPEFSFSAGIDHTFSLPNGATLNPSLSYRWTDEQYSSFMIQPYSLRPSFSVVDFSLSYNAVKNWSVNLYANNALNEHYYTVIQAEGAVVFPADPRIMGCTLNYNF